MPSPSQLLDSVAIGNDAGWALTFHTETEGRIDDTPTCAIGREQYYGEIEASLPEGLDGGKYTFVVEGLIEDDYRKIDPPPPNPGSPASPRPAVVRLYLYWRDANASPAGYLASVAGLGDLFGGLTADGLQEALVAELAVTGVTRKAGTRRYETTITAQERAFQRLAGKRLKDGFNTDSFLTAAEQLARDAGISLSSYGFNRDGSLPAGSGANPGDDQAHGEKGATYLSVMGRIAESVEQITGKRGRGMLLVRDGTLHLGPRFMPLEGETKELSFQNGLLDAAPTSEESRDPNADLAEAPTLAGPRMKYTLTLKGRPDLKPGDLVSFQAASAAAPLPGASIQSAVGAPVAEIGEGTTVTLYVSSVEHKLGRTSGFATTVAGVSIKDADDAWDTYTDGASETPAADTGSKGAAANGAVQAAKAIKALAQDAAAAARHAEIGEVREMHVEAGSSAEPPAQTLKVWRGLAAPDGRANQARRLEVRREGFSPTEGVAYTSPFAWGKCGLVLPRYPGTRVVMVHRNGQAEDPIEVGAVWESGQGPKSEAGDWWLILPVDVPSSDRASVDDETTPTKHEDKATNDLIDAEGKRVIEVGELTIRAGKEKLKGAGERPTPGAETITIENAEKEAKITIDKDGTIVIHAAKNLKVEAPEGDLELTAKNNLKLTASKVDVKVSDKMDVHG
jgi:hypothetical protein